MRKNKHLSIEERSTIKVMLDSTASFKTIAKKLGRDCTTISKEIRNHLIFQKTGCYGRPFNDCANRRSCSFSDLCCDTSCRFKHCSNCSKCTFTVLIILKNTALLLQNPRMSVMPVPDVIPVP